MKRFFILVAMLIMTTSCNDWLNVSPRTEVNVDDMFDEDGFVDVLTACYMKMNGSSAWGNCFTMTTLEYMAQHWDLTNSSEKDIMNFNYEAEGNQSMMKSMYAAMYNIISQANLVLDNLETYGNNIKTDKKRAYIEAEALAIRAMCHFEILRLFGQVPINPTIMVKLPYAEEVSKETVPYYSNSDFIAKIRADYQRAEKLLKDNGDDECFKVNKYIIDNDDSFYSYRGYRMNYFAVKALQARMELYVGNKTEAYNDAKLVIENSGINLSGNSEISSGYYCLPSEGILILKNTGMYSSYSSELFNSYMNITTARLTNDIFKGHSTAINNRFRIWTTKTSSQGVVSPVLQKFIKPTSDLTSSLSLEIIPLVRLSEVYLIAMECAPDLATLNSYYLPYMLQRNEQVTGFTSLDDAQEEIVNEYRREFYGEGYMFYVYKRLGTKDLLWKTDASMTESMYVVPLPKSELGE